MRMTGWRADRKATARLVAISSTRIWSSRPLLPRDLQNRMKAAGEDPEQRQCVVISHEPFRIHINGLAVLAKKLVSRFNRLAPRTMPGFRIIPPRGAAAKTAPRDLREAGFFRKPDAASDLRRCHHSRSFTPFRTMQ